jgi:hypothetical protein
MPTAHAIAAHFAGYRKRRAKRRNLKAALRGARPIVKSWDEALDVVDGKKVIHDGVESIVKIDRSRKFDTRFELHPTAKGRKSEAYLESKRKLRDDYITDLTQSPEAAVRIAERFVQFKP